MNVEIFPQQGKYKIHSVQVGPFLVILSIKFVFIRLVLVFFSNGALACFYYTNHIVIDHEKKNKNPRESKQ